MLISTVMFIFSEFFSFIFLGKIWSQNLKFFKFTEIWQSGRLRYAYSISTLTFIFSKYFSFIFLGQIWSQNLRFFRLTEIWYRGRLPYTYFKCNGFFSKIFLLHIFFGEICSHKIAKSNEIWFSGTLYMLISTLTFTFSKFFSFIFFLVSLGPKCEVLQID